MAAEQRRWTGLVFIATSVDGYIARPDGDLDWLTDPPPETRHAPAHEGEDAPPDYDAFTADISHLVMGRGTYEKVLTFGDWPYDRFRVVVLSTTLETDDERITVVRTVDEARAVLDEHATSVYVDGGEVVSRFLADGLVDELTISRAPVILGDGIPLFRTLPDTIRLLHLGTSTTDSGMTSTATGSRYRRRFDDRHPRHSRDGLDRGLVAGRGPPRHGQQRRGRLRPHRDLPDRPPTRPIRP